MIARASDRHRKLTVSSQEVELPQLVDQGRTPSVLAVTSELPWPLDTGGHLRTFHLLQALSRRFHVRLVVPALEDQDGALERLRSVGIDVVPASVGPRVGHWEAVRALISAAKHRPYVLYGRHDRKPVWAALRHEARRGVPDVLYLDHLDSWLYRSAFPDVPAAVDLHNVYSTLTRREAAERASRCARVYLRREATLLEAAELSIARSADVLMTVSEDDRRHFSAFATCPVHLVPNGVDCAAYRDLPAGRRFAEPTILYVGSLSWGPNVAAARTLAVDLLPGVRERIPGARVRIVGRNPAPEVLVLSRIDGVEVSGCVPEIAPYLREAAVLAVPLEAGGGTRLKILEAFAAGLPVVSTPVGCEGLEVVDGEHLFVAHRQQFVDRLVEVLVNRSFGEQLADRARALVQERYDWDSVGESAVAAVAAACSGTARRQ